MAEQGRDWRTYEGPFRPCRKRSSPSPPPERKGRSWGGGKGAPWSPESQEDSGGSSSPWWDSNLEGDVRSWLPPVGEEEEEGWGPPMSSPQEAQRESKWGSMEPPRKRARSPPTGEGWRGSLSPPKGRAWRSPVAQRQPSALSSHPPTQGKNSSSRSGTGVPPRYPHSPPVSRGRRGSPKQGSRGRLLTRPKGPSTTWDSESPRPPKRRAAEGRLRGLEEPAGGNGSSSSRRSQWDLEWETRQGYPKGRRKAGGGSGERWRGSSFPRGEGDWASRPSRGRKRDLDGGRERRWYPAQDQGDWDSSLEVLEDWIPKEGREGKESGQRGLSGRPAKRPAPAVGWVPCEEVVSYWKRCQSLLPKTKSQFLSTCPRATVPDGSTRVQQLNWSLLHSLSKRQALKVSLATRYSFVSQNALMDMLAQAMALYEMAESAIENRQALDPLDVQELARRLFCYLGSVNQSLTTQRCAQVLRIIAPQLRRKTNQLSSRSGGGLLFAEEKVKLVEDAILKSIEGEKEANLNNCRSSDREAETQDYTSLELWHRRFAHADSKAILQLHKHNLNVVIKVNPGDIERIDRCVFCLADKGKKPSFPLKTVINSARLLDLIHCELCGPFSALSKEKPRYALIFVDDFSRYCVTYLLKKLRQTKKYFRLYIAMLSKLREVRDPKAFQFNSAGESVSYHVKRILEQQGIPHKSGIKENPGESRTAAREVSSLLEMTRCMLADARLPNQFWDSAIMVATYLLNRLPIIGRKKTPFQVWQGSMPSIGHIRVFGSLAYNRNTPHCPAPYIFTGYDISQKAYRVMNLETGHFSTKWYIRVDEHKRADRKLTVLGHDAEPLLATAESGRKESGDDTEGESSTPEDGDGDEQPAADEPKEASGPPSAPEPDMGRSEPLPRNEPTTWDVIEEMPADEAKKWHGAAREEIEGLRKNATWTLTKLPPGKHAVGCKWVFKVKPGPEGQAERYTARLVLQKLGEDVDATVTPDVKLSTTRMLLNVSASKQMQVKHLEVKTASLCGEAMEELYMEQPPGFVDQKRPDWVCKLKKDLRGLKEASRAWDERLEKILSQRGFKQDEADHSLYRRSRHGRLMFILTCAGDLVVASQHEADYKEIVGSLGEAAEVKELGGAAGYLGSLTERAVDGSSLVK